MHGARHPAIELVIVAVLLLAVPRAATAEDRSDVRSLTRAYNASGQVLFRQFSAGTGNIVFSPYSIGTAMAMVLAGTRGETEREMAAVLQLRLARDAVNDANAAVLATLNAYDQSRQPPVCPQAMALKGERCEARPAADGQCTFLAHRAGETCIANPRFPRSAQLMVANALMLSAGAPVAAGYAGLLRDRYAAEVFEGADADTVNAWVSKRTEGKIERIAEKMSDLMLVNAVYFKSRWAVPFNTRNTRPEFFNLSRTRQEMVATMLQRTRHAVIAREGYRAIRLPYVVRSLGMVIALPDEVDGLREVAQRFDSDELASLLAALNKAPPRQVVLMLPRFRAEFTANLIEPFRHAGMSLAFDRNRSDFSAMTGLPPASAPTAIDQIVHHALIEVSEELTEAASATSIGISIASAPPPPAEPIQFRVDRPFLYFVVDDASGAVLFQGRVADPRQT